MKKILTGLLTLMLFTATAFTATAQLNELSEFLKQRSINVSGTAEMEVVPDEIYVQVDLREYDKKGVGKVDIEKIKNNFIKACISIGIPDTNISIQGYQGWDGNYWLYKKNKKKNPDMMASISYWVKLSNTKKMDELVDKLDDEATQNFFIAKVSHSKVQEFKKQLKVQAIKAAKDKAIYLAAALGENIGSAITINEPNEINVYPMPMYSNRMMKQEAAMAADAGSAPEPNIDFKKIKYQFEVNVVFALGK